MCGIIALLCMSNDVRKKLLDGLKMLQNRGYDSCGGIMFDKDTESWFWKKASSGCQNKSENKALMHDAMYLLSEAVDKVPKSINYRGGFFQTRWATHGAKTDANAHPHFDSHRRFYVVHNGIITNYTRLKTRLMQKGYIFTSETDTEVIPHLLVDCYANRKSSIMNMFQIWKMVVGELEGTWSLIMCDMLHPDRIYVAKNGSPLLMAFSDDNKEIWFSSERSGFELYVRKYVLDIPDGTVLECRRGIRENWIINTSSEHFSKGLQNHLSAKSEDDVDISVMGEIKESLFLPESFQVLKKMPDPYRYWTELEISEQPDKLWEALNCGGRLYRADDNRWHVKLGGLERFSARLKKVRHVVLTGCGTSYHAALFSLFLFRQISGLMTVQVIDASEFVMKDLPQDTLENIAVVVVSQSGETKDCQRVIECLTEMGVITIGVVNTVGSWIARETTCGIYLNAGREVGVASTKSFTSQAMVLSLLALWFGQENGKSIDKWAPLLCGLSLRFKNVMLDVSNWVKLVLPKVQDQSSMFLLGRGFSYPICLEGALKLKELTYQNAEGYPGGALKHGPFALIDGKSETPVFLHLWRGPNYGFMLSAVEQVTSRGAGVMILHNDPNEKDLQKRFPTALFFYIDCEDEWSCSLLSVMVYQMLSVELALKKGLNPDYPRNLAKVVSVDG
jgi:glucosamine--fructose-6-phosphate aminotransferase (isomerizing)